MDINITLSEIESFQNALNELADVIYKNKDALYQFVYEKTSYFESAIFKVKSLYDQADYDHRNINYQIDKNNKEIRELRRQIDNTSTGDNDTISFLSHQIGEYQKANYQQEILLRQVEDSMSRFRAIEGEMKQNIHLLASYEKDLASITNTFLATISSTKDKVADILTLVRKISEELSFDSKAEDGVHIQNASMLKNIADELSKAGSEISESKKELLNASRSLSSAMQDETSKLASNYVLDLINNRSLTNYLEEASQHFYNAYELVQRYKNIA